MLHGAELITLEICFTSHKTEKKKVHVLFGGTWHARKYDKPMYLMGIEIVLCAAIVSKHANWDASLCRENLELH